MILTMILIYSVLLISLLIYLSAFYVLYKDSKKISEIMRECIKRMEEAKKILNEKNE